jgi:hypothetical protein
MTRRFPFSNAQLAILTCLLTAGGTLQPHPRVAATNGVQAKPFVVSSLDNTFFAFVGELKGEFSVTADSVLVNVTAGKLLLRANLPTYNGPRVFGGIVLRFAREGATPGSWALEGRGSMPAGFNISIAPGQEMPLPPMHFALAKPRERALPSVWLVFELWDTSPLREGRTRSPTSAFIQSSRDIFASKNE